jgi:hypothetical protein
MIENYFTNSADMFVAKIDKTMPTFFSVDKMQKIERDSYIEVVIPLSFQQLAEDLTDEFAESLRFHVLYARKSYDDKIYHVVLYSIPYEHEMVVIHMDSLQHGILEEIRVKFFSSMEVMYNHVRQLWHDSLFMKDKLLEGVEQEAELLMDFC